MAVRAFAEFCFSCYVYFFECIEKSSLPVGGTVLLLLVVLLFITVMLRWLLTSFETDFCLSHLILYLSTIISISQCFKAT